MRRHNFAGQKKGFTLIEIIVVIAIASIMLMVLVNIYLAFTRLYSRAVATTETTGATAVSLGEMQKWLLPAQSILSSVVISGTTYTTSSTTLAIQLFSIDASGNVISGTYDTVVFHASGTNAYRILSPSGSSSRQGGTKELTHSLTSLVFSYNNAQATLANQVSVDLTVSASGRNASSYHVTQKLYLRNQ